MKGIIRHLKKATPAYLAIGLYSAYLGAQVYFIKTNPFREIGEGYSIREIGDERQIFIGTNCGLARVAVDSNKDGTLDYILQNKPISAFMGGPGYRAGVEKATEKDKEHFEKASRLLNSIGEKQY